MISRSPAPPPSQVWKAQEAATHAGGVDPCPAGWPRPRHDGLPVPWVTPVDRGRAHWALLHGERLRRCQEEWLCQVCGLPLPERAYVLADADGELTTSAAMHRRCTVLALTVCPGLPPDLLLAVVSRDDLLGDGVALDERALSTWKSWSLTPAALAAAATVGSGTADALTAAAPAGNATEAACGTPSPPAPTAPGHDVGRAFLPVGCIEEEKMVMFRLADDRGRVLGVFDSPEQAKGGAAEADWWKPVEGGHEGDCDGWRANYSLYDKAHFTIRAVGF